MEKDDQKPNPVAPTVAFDYIKSPIFRSIRADGVVGGLTPSGHMHMAFYSEREAIPRRVIQEINQDGSLGKTRGVQTRDSIVREMDIDVFLTKDVAEALHEWLGKIIKELNKQ